ncbi:MAG TPA: P1 family peptidase [Thermomicrobiales bacterium]|nr:P1 family peptidase [Thermomicrobiales bacterium]
MTTTETRHRLRDLGIAIGRLQPGPHNAITDVSGVKVGHSTIIEGEGDLVVGKGPIRTGATVVWPHSDGSIAADPVYGAYHQLNGNGEMTGIPWIIESGLVSSPIAITNTHSVGVVRDALIAYELARFPKEKDVDWGLPIVAETYDGWLNDINGFHVKPEHLFAAADSATAGPVVEGCVGGGTGMNCHEFKGGIGTSSRVLQDPSKPWTVGVLVQANYGLRANFRVDGVPVGRELTYEHTPGMREKVAGAGSIIIIIATDAPILPDQCRRLAQRAAIGLARVGGNGNNSSGDIFLAFSTGNRGMMLGEIADPFAVQSLQPEAMSPLFEAVADATEEAILNALCAATTMVGANGRTSHALPLTDLQDVMRKYNRL